MASIYIKEKARIKRECEMTDTEIINKPLEQNKCQEIELIKHKRTTIHSRIETLENILLEMHRKISKLEDTVTKLTSPP